MPLLDQPVGGSTLPVLNGLNGTIPDKTWVRLRQPWVDDRGRACVTINDVQGGFTRNDSTGGEKRPLLRNYLVNDLRNMGFNLPMVCNAATLRKEEWIQLDRTIIPAARSRLRLASDLESAGLTFGGFNAMGKMTLEYQAESDPGAAYVDMDALSEGSTVDTPLYILRSLPLPITHADFGYSERELQVSRSSGFAGLDVTMGEKAARRVGEVVDDTIGGLVTGTTYATQTAGPGTHTGTSTVYGYRNFPQRLTGTFTVPTGSNASTTLTEVLDAIEDLQAQFYYGPYVIYHSTLWSQYLDNVFSVSGGNHPGETLRSMIMKNPNITDIRRVDRLDSTYGYVMIFVQMTSDVVQLVNGMDITTIQWQEKGGLALRFKVMCIKVPRLRSDYNSRTGILHTTH